MTLCTACVPWVAGIVKAEFSMFTRQYVWRGVRAALMRTGARVRVGFAVEGRVSGVRQRPRNLAARSRGEGPNINLQAIRGQILDESLTKPVQRQDALQS